MFCSLASTSYQGGAGPLAAQLPVRCCLSTRPSGRRICAMASTSELGVAVQEAPSTPVPAGARAVSDVTPVKRTHRPPASCQGARRKARVDLDDYIACASQEVKVAQKALAKARAEARDERRKRQRVVKKASTLTVADLEHLAALKRCGLWGPERQSFTPPTGDADADAPRAGTSAAASSSGPRVTGGSAAAASSTGPSAAAQTQPSDDGQADECDDEPRV